MRDVWHSGRWQKRAYTCFNFNAFLDMLKPWLKHLTVKPLLKQTNICRLAKHV